MSLISRRAALLGLGVIGAGVSRAETSLKVGDMAPNVSLPATTGKTETLASYKGKNNVVLAFFPKAFTGGCTKEMKGYQTGIAQFTDSNSKVFGISLDDIETNKRFAQELGLEFALLSDTSGDTAKAYGVYNAERNIASRATFVVDKSGKITHIEEGSGAVDIGGAAAACTRLK
jgi:thioredoxin-dependent peroxiredoxin